MTSERCLALGDRRARDRAVAGAKAAGLARAAAVGLPVLPGVVVPTVEATAVTDVAGPLLAAGELGRVRRAAMAVQPDEDLVRQLSAAVEDFGAPLIVRSSSPLEGDGLWSGAFSTLHGVAHDELATALRACWGSAFAPDAVERAEHEQVAVEDLALAVLVQPEVVPEVGGTARLDAGGHVTVAATDGPLRGLMEGWVEGQQAVVSHGGDVDTDGLDAAVATDVAALVRATAEALGHDLVEWARVDGRILLLQSMHSRATPGTASAAPITAAHATDQALHLALLTQRFPGPLGEQLVLPWAVTVPEDIRGDVAPATDRLNSRDRLARVRAAANELVSQLWTGSPRGATHEAARTLRQLRGTNPARALERIAELPRPFAPQVAATLADLARLRDELVARGVVEDEWSFWRLSEGELDAAVAGRPVERSVRAGVGRWEPFVHAVVRAAGSSYAGVPVNGGAGGGPVHAVADVWSQPALRGRYVLIADSPLPALSPLLWQAAGLVTRRGNASAHLLEFAASIGVPTVVGAQVPSLDPGAEWHAAVDGDAGVVSVLRTDRAPNPA